MLGRDLGPGCRSRAAGSHGGSLSGGGTGPDWQPSEGPLGQGEQAPEAAPRGRQGGGTGGIRTRRPPVGLPVPRSWSPRTVDPNHVLQDEDSLGQDLQRLPQLLHPLALGGGVGRRQPRSGPSRLSVLSQPPPRPPLPSCHQHQYNSHHRADIPAPGLGFELLFRDTELDAQRG